MSIQKVKDYVLDPNITLGASETNTVVSKLFPITQLGSRNLRIKVTAASSTVATGITAKLQHAPSYDDTFVTTTKSVSITGNGDFYLTLNVEVSGDQAEMPLMPIGRVVVTTGVGDAVTITAVDVMQGY